MMLKYYILDKIILVQDAEKCTVCACVIHKHW